ncbi:unnamed protein product [Ambrosiozyma monospora]|uniref:Unnamed protein product n=1 Tax=Ambrosiozyma monospora TaxID=43982 RepID=A0ACB5TDN0_AMBMO|nr:unnamed protein product [Ambrosiozyma monospora]
MWVPITIFTIITVLISAISVNKFIKLRQLQPTIIFILLVSLFLPLSLIFLLPIDLISSVFKSDSVFKLNNDAILMIWRINYWITFGLTWVILPFLQYWFDSGYFNSRDKLRDSVFKLIKFQLLMILAGLAGLIYLIVHYKSKLTFAFVKSLVITCSHIYSLTLALFLLSHGLITIPMHIWNNCSNYELALSKTYVNLPPLNEKLGETRFELKELCSKIKSIENLQDMIPLEFRDWVIDLVAQIPQEFLDEYLLMETVAVEDINVKNLTSLTKKLHRAKWKYNHGKISLQSQINKAVKLEDMVNSKLLSELSFRLTEHSSFIFRRNPKLAYFYHIYVSPVIGVIVSIALITLSVIVVASEELHGSKISFLSMLSTKFLKDDVKILIISVVMLTYICFASLVSLSKVKIFNIYHIESNQSSDPVRLD